MIRIDKLRLFPFKTSELFFDNTVKYNIIYFPENTDFISAYDKLHIKRRFVKYGTIVSSKIPRVLVNMNNLKHFKALKLYPIAKVTDQSPSMFIDTSLFFSRLDSKYTKGSYRRPIVQKVSFDYLSRVFNSYNNGRENVLLYHADLSKPIPDSVFDRRIYLLVQLLKNSDVTNIDYILVCFTKDGNTQYSAIKIKDDVLPLQRFFSISKTIRSDDIDEQEDIETFSKNSVNLLKADNSINTGKSESRENYLDDKVSSSIKEYIRTSPNKESFLKANLNDIDLTKLALKSIIYSVTGDRAKSEEVVSKIPSNDYTRALKRAKIEFAPEILESNKYTNKTTDEVYKVLNHVDINNNAEPSKTLNKRKVDFEKSFESDLLKVFRVLEKQNDKFPLKVKSVKKSPVPIDPGDLQPTKHTNFNITLVDDRNNEHTVDINIPEIQQDGTFLINGKKKFLIYQILIDPIYFLKKGKAQLQTLYAPVNVNHKQTIHKSYFECYIAGYKLPLFALFGYHIGFNDTCKLFGLTPSISDEEVNDEKHYSLKTRNGKYLVFSYDGSLHSTILLNSIKEFPGELDDPQGPEFYSKRFFREVIVREVGHRNCLYKIDKVLKNIMEPISVQVLKTKLLPVTLHECLHYMCVELAKGRVDRRNDINKQRIRSSEVFNFMIQKLIISSYDEYVQNREHGNNEATFYCDTRKIISEIQNSQLIRDVENINPIEELSVMTRVTPVGPGGIPDKHAVTKEARNLDSSYFGNFEPMDTPENESVGMINQLTLDAAISNVRGSFGHFTDKDIGASVLSTSTAIVPFVNSCDGNRVMMGSSQCRQAIPILGFEQPLVQTGYETIMTSMLSESYIRKAPVDGQVVKITENVIYIKNPNNNRIHKVAMKDELLRSAQGMDSMNRFHSSVKVGQKVKKDQIVAEGKHIKDGVISIGTNLLTALMGWKGYGFEDGYIISEEIANKKFTSTSYEEISVFLKTGDNLKFIAERGASTKSGDPLIIKTSKDIEELLDLDEDELLDGQQGIIKQSPGGKIIDIEIYPNISMNKFPELIPQFEKFKERYIEQNGQFPTKFLMNDAGKKVPFAGIKIVFKIERYDQCLVGDKISNNHGGKGVLAMIEKTDNMPITPWGDRVELIFNPLAIINRMNPSTLYELYTGLIAKTLAKKLVSFGLQKSPRAMKLIADVYTSLDKTDGKKMSEKIIKSYMKLNDAQWAEYIKKIKQNNYVIPIFIPPFQAPTLDMIQKTLKMMGLKSKYNLDIPGYGKTLEPVSVGYLYYKKLEQQAAYKMSARSIGKYQTGVNQPTAGKKKGGGQKLGEFDTWAIMSHGADTLLKELLGPMSDDRKVKDEILFEILQNGSASYRDSTKSHAKDLLKIYTMGMMLEADL